MLEQLRRLFGLTAESPSPYAEYDPVYGLPKRAVEEWLAHNPGLKEEYAVEEWLARNPPLRQEYVAVLQQSKMPPREAGALAGPPKPEAEAVVSGRLG